MLLGAKRSSGCPALEAQLEDYLEGRLDSRKAAEAENHLKSCVRCNAVFSNAGECAGLLRAAAGPEPNVNPSFASRVMAAISGERRQEETWKPVETAAWRLCWAATVAALLLAAFLVRARITGPTLPPVQQNVQALVNVPMPLPATQDDTVLLVASEDHVR